MTQKEKNFNYQVLNNLIASFQGKFTELCILDRLRDDLELKDEIEYSQQVLATLHAWYKNLHKGTLIFGSDINQVDLEAYKACGELLNFLGSEYNEKGLIAKKLNASQEPYRTYNEVADLISHFARYIYTTETLLIQQKDYLVKVEKSKNTQDIDSRIQETSELANNLQEFIEASSKLEEQGRYFYDLLKFHTRLVPGFYRAFTHEFAVLLCGPGKYFTFNQGNFYSVEAKAWEKENFSASEAGYWRAYEISPTDAKKCINIGLNQPSEAASWLTAGFTIESAKPWIDVWFSPILAKTWNQSGFKPRDAAVFVRKGIYHPLNVPQDNLEANKIYSEGLTELAQEMKALKEKNRRTRKRNDIL